MVFPKGYKKSAAMVVLRHGSQFLLLKRAKPPHQGKYVPVGGKLEPFEDPFSAAKRELEEETGLQLDHLQYCGVLIETSPIDYNWQCNIYLADIDFIPPPYCDEGELEWVAYQDVGEIPTPPTDRQIYQFIMQKRPFALNAVYNAELELMTMVEELRQENLV